MRLRAHHGVIVLALGLFLMGAAARLHQTPSAPGPVPPAEDWAPIAITVTPAELGSERLPPGRLTHLGGLQLASDDRRFGGFSGLHVAADGALLAVSDKGHWLAGKLAFDPASGRLVGFQAAAMACMTDERGRHLHPGDQADAEGLARLPDGRFAVSFEHIHKVRIYDLDASGPLAPAVAGPQAGKAAPLNANRGLEALAGDGQGGLILGAQARAWARLDADGLESDAPLMAFQPYPGVPAASLVGLDHVSGQRFVALERLWRPYSGVSLWVRALRLDRDANRLRPDPAAGPNGLLLELNPKIARGARGPGSGETTFSALDNFEAIAAAPAPQGGVRLFIVSDDNFRRGRQRTLIHAFHWAPPADE